MYLMIILVGFAINVAVGALLGSIKGRAHSAAIWAFILGPPGWLIVLLLKDRRSKCPGCGKPLPEKCKTCKHCGLVIPPTTPENRENL